MGMKLKNRYFLLRHGETVYQTKKKGFTYPWPDKPPVKLTKMGEKEIKNLAKKLKTKKIDLIFSSDIFRAQKTAEIVAKELGIKKINFDKRLRDVNLGIYHSKTKEEFYRDFPDPKERFFKKPKGGESWNNVKKRIKNFINDISKKHRNKNILIVSHGDPLWLFEGILRGLSNQEFLDEIFYKKNYIKIGELREIWS